MKLRKSMIEDFDICPLRFKYVWVDGLESTEAAANAGTMVHDYAADFFELVDRSEIESMVRIDDLMKYFTQWIQEGGPERYLIGCENFCKFEMEHLLALRKKFKDPDTVWHYWVPYAMEYYFETDKTEGTIDRLSWLEDGTLIATDYKPKIRTTKYRREVTWYAHNVNQYKLLDPLRVSMGSVYAYLENKHWIFDLHPRTLKAINNRIKKMNECMRTGEYPPKLGYHCAWCPGRFDCDAMKEGEKY